MDYRHLPIVLTAFLVAACPRESSSVTHTSILEQRPDIACLWDILVGIAKVPKVETIRNETWVGVNHIFHFETGKAPHIVGVLIGDDGSFTYSNSAWAPNRTLPELRAAQLSVFDVDKALDGQCNLKGLVDNVRQSCSGKNCDKLDTVDY